MWNEVTIDSPVDEMFYQPDSHKSCILVDQITEARSIYESPRSSGSFWFASCNRKVDKQKGNLLKISCLREPPGQLEDQAQELSRNRGRQCTRPLVNIRLQNWPVGILLWPSSHCGLCSCWC